MNRQNDLSCNSESFLPADEASPQKIVTYTAEHAVAGGGLPLHRHARAQLLATQSGSVAVMTDDGTYVVPPERALFIPANVPHRTRHLAATRVQAFYIRPEAAAHLPARTSVVHVSPLLRQIIQACMAMPCDYDEAGQEGRLVDVLLDQIAVSDVLPLHVQLPVTGALRTIAEAIIENPADRTPVSAWAKESGMSVRTLERRFSEETGATFRSFRVQAKLLKAVELLAQGLSVNQVSDILGFEAPSAFVYMFRSALGYTPGRYFSNHPENNQ